MMEVFIATYLLTAKPYSTVLDAWSGMPT